MSGAARQGKIHRKRMTNAGQLNKSVSKKLKQLNTNFIIRCALDASRHGTQLAGNDHDNLHAVSLSVRGPLESIVGWNAHQSEGPVKTYAPARALLFPKSALTHLAQIFPNPTLPRGSEAPGRKAFKSYSPCKNRVEFRVQSLDARGQSGQ